VDFRYIKARYVRKVRHGGRNIGTRPANIQRAAGSLILKEIEEGKLARLRKRLRRRLDRDPVLVEPRDNLGEIGVLKLRGDDFRKIPALDIAHARVLRLALRDAVKPQLIIESVRYRIEFGDLAGDKARLRRRQRSGKLAERRRRIRKILQHREDFRPDFERCRAAIDSRPFFDREALARHVDEEGVGIGRGANIADRSRRDRRNSPVDAAENLYPAELGIERADDALGLRRDLRSELFGAAACERDDELLAQRRDAFRDRADFS